MRRLCGSAICSCATRTGPMGAEESKPERPSVSTLISTWAGELDLTFRERPLAIPELFRSRTDVVATRIT